MKYKMMSLLAVLGLGLTAVIFNTDWNTGKARIHQHLSWPEQSEQPAVTTDWNAFTTHLPIVEINTENQKIPGNWIYNDEGVITGAEKSNTGEDTIRITLRIIDSGTSDNRPGDDAAVDTLACFRIRGNTSRDFSKKSYAVELIDEEGNGKPQSILGMYEHDSWALHGPFLDKTLIRNYMWLNLSADIMGYAPNVRFCEVFLDGEYQGLYLMMETIDRGEGRVNLTEYKQGAGYTDYIVRIDKETGVKDLDIFSEYTLKLDKTGSRSTLSVVYPGTKNLNDEIFDYIEKDFSKFEKVLYSSDYTDPIKGYRRYIDVDSFVDYYILQEFLCNNDMCNYSTYLYKDRLGKIHMGPVWDYNNMLDNYIAQEMDGSEILYADRLWYDRLLADPYFNKKVIQRYKSLRRTILNEDYLMRYMDETIRYLGAGIDRNFLVWGYSFDPSLLDSRERLRPLERNPSDYEEAVDDMKEFIRIRGRWLDNNIDTLAQYCHESKAKVYDAR